MKTDNCQKLASVILLAVLLPSCHNRQAEFINFEKWRTVDSYYDRQLRSHPAEVKESTYIDLNDTTLDAKGRFAKYELYQFDVSGNRVVYKTFAPGWFTYEMKSEYGSEGMKSNSFITYEDTVRLKSGLESNTVSARIGGNKFKSTFFEKGVYRYDETTTFFSGGQTVKTERWKRDTLLSNRTDFFKEDRLIKREIVTQYLRVEEVFYYSSRGWLDSIVAFDNNIRSGRKQYVNNEYGDPVYYVEIDGDIVKEKLRAKYRYDEKGNWVRQLKYEEKDDRFSTPALGEEPHKFAGYTMITREIKY